MMSNQAIFCVTKRGTELALDINKSFPSDIYVIRKFAVEGTIPFDSLSHIIQETFKKYRYLVFVMATGIVTRVIAKHIVSKETDPAVISLDEGGTFVIPLLSGHLGGANERSMEISKCIEAIPTITTATDVSGSIAVDTLAGQLECRLRDLESAKKVTSLILQGKKVKINLPDNVGTEIRNSEGIIIISNREEVETTQIIPKNIVVGIGCKRETKRDSIVSFIKDTFMELNLSPKSIKSLASAWVKEDEKGLLEAGKVLGVHIKFYNKGEIEKVEEFIKNKSEFVKDTIGVYGVSEPCAYLASNMKGHFITRKAKREGITLSIYEEY